MEMDIRDFEYALEDLKKERAFAIKMDDWTLARKIDDKIKELNTKMLATLYKKYGTD